MRCLHVKLFLTFIGNVEDLNLGPNLTPMETLVWCVCNQVDSTNKNQTIPIRYLKIDNTYTLKEVMKEITIQKK